MLGMMGSQVLHGSVTLKNSSGGFTTYDFQSGTAETVASGAITVLSADSFSQTYQVLSSTVMRDSSQGVQHGDTVTVVGVVDGANVDAKQVIDMTELQAARGTGGGWGGRHRYGSTSTSSTTTTTVGAARQSL